MSQAVRKVLLAGIYYNGTLTPGVAADPSQNFMLQWPYAVDIQNSPVSDAELGSELRAEVKAIRKVEMAWKQLSNLVPAAPVTGKPAAGKKGK